MSNSPKIEQLKKLLNCSVCSKLLDRPVTLPCGESICESHLDEIFNNQCRFCDKHHPKSEYSINQSLSQMIELQVNTIKLSPKFESCKQSINRVEDIMNQADLVYKDPNNFIYEYFDEIKQGVYIRRENLKIQIDDYYNWMIEKIIKTERTCYDLATRPNEIKTSINNYKREFNELKEKFDSFEIDDAKYDDLNIKSDNLQPKLLEALDKYKYSLIGNKDYEFLISRVKEFDLFVSYSRRFSNIIDRKKFVELMYLCEFPVNLEFKLIYRATEHGFSATKFHQKCDGISNTLTIIKTTVGNVFGGYAGSA